MPKRPTQGRLYSLKASEPTSVITQAAKDLIKWLARERIDEASFKKCAELARELAYPNQHGLIIRESIEQANERLRGLNAPISLVSSGSLGRMMFQDQDDCYFVSIVASLASYYGNEPITDIICSLIIDRTAMELLVLRRHRRHGWHTLSDLY
ncbi:hypothetical protein FOPG_16050 [Fusarium oxysporum f. sp. conglutinans race 2 54008]|uniref:Uncharacterized protein n=2 Tax=Fusarium oxysporum f. sp. conglutinans TaxID=100902 RepID=F9FJ63_FUSOF|nr:hypothetical protein FOXB_06442 [Fusarium oxysporum f. sp. conglutinans Fo5176]EXL67850.1 hypothetical protein FOPG_16050 [Fusarium oxysporum f. sp. conglutinans race 2 54008]KAI8406677.1 hypothetical protein FOFC_12100 [Fusarium oxysporum]KAI8419645.1 hypothetical protein FOFC_02235 [Fusarium oxysporum]